MNQFQSETNTYILNKPYPQPAGLMENKRAACVLLKSYSGVCSEMTAVNQYMYHYLKATGCNPQIPEALRQIAEVELKHLYLLGLVICQLGVNPKLRTIGKNGAGYWNARNIEYGRTVKDMLVLDIESEQDQIKQYEKAITRISNTQIQALLSRIIEDEVLHVKILGDILAKYF